MYDFKKKEEFLWLVGVSVATALFQVLAELNPEKITDWKVWIVGVGAGLVRAAAAAALIGLARFKNV